MEKKSINGGSCEGYARNLFRKMKLVVTFFLLGLLTVSASTYSQQAKFSLKCEDVSVKEVFKQIEDNSDFILFYNEDYVDVNRKVSIDAREKNVEYILDEVFRETQNSYKIYDRQIVILAPGITNVPFGAENGSVQAKRISVSGKVTDSSRAPLPGVSIIVKGTTNGIISDADGNYLISNVPSDAVLIFSFVGMKLQEIPVLGKETINVEMEDDLVGIEEVVAVGYGSMKKSDLTGSISSVSAEDFKLQPIMRSTDALAARISGVQVTTTSGNPDASVKIRIRGANSINGGNDPLYVCDGVVGAGMPSVEEIESIEVLKDASATAIYGSRGANGVILITTKRGSTGKTHISFNTFSSLQMPSNLYDVLDAYSYAQEVNTLVNSVYSDEQLADYKNNGGTDWQDEVLQSCWNQNYHLAVDGGNKDLRYHISGQYKKLNGLLKRTSSEGYSIRSNFDINLYKNVKLEWFINGGYSHLRNTGSNQNLGGADAVLFNALTWGPTESVYESDGSYNQADPYGAMGKNPVMMVNEINKWNNNYSISSNSALTWEIIPKLSIQYRLNLSYAFNNSYKWESSTYTQSYAISSGTKSLTKSIFQNVVVNWKKDIGEHHLDLTAVGEGSSSTYDALSGSGSYFDNENLEYWGMVTGTTQTGSTGWSDQSLLSFVGRANYNYADKYYLTAAMRADGSSKFADGNKWGYFPSGSLAWRVSEENFVKDLNVFSDMKIRASYGKTGNQGVDPYSTIASLSMVGTNYTSADVVYGYTSQTINKNLQWEETGQVDFGIDAGFLKNRLNVTADYYRKETKKLLLETTTALYVGGDDIYVNKGEVRNTGWEFSINAIPVERKDLKWEIMANFSTNKNEIVDLDGETIYDLSSAGNNDAILSDDTYILKEGLPLGCLYGYKWLGIWQEDEAEEAAKYGNVPGDNKYANLEGDDTTIDDSDRTNIGNGTPKYIWGLNTTLIYKKWDFNIVLQGVADCDKLNVMYAMASSQQSKTKTITLRDAWENSWTSENKSNRFPNATSTTSTTYMNSTQWIQDASFVRVKNVSLGYTFDRRVLKVGECHLYLSAQNLFTFTNYKGYDPETTSTITSDVCTGIDTGITPTARTFTIGAQLSF